MIVRAAQLRVERTLRERRAVILTGLPRTGRSVLARTIAGEQDGLVVDAGLSSGLAVLADIDVLSRANGDRLIVIDKVTASATELVIAVVRAAQEVRTPPRFLLLAADTRGTTLLGGGLIGLATTVELSTIGIEEDLEASRPLTLAAGPSPASPLFTVPNAPQWSQAEHWLRGGLPESLSAESGAESHAWRVHYLDGLLGCDHTASGIDAGDRLRDVLQWIANGHGSVFDEVKCGGALAVGRTGVRRCLELLTRIGLLRRLDSWPTRSNGSMGRQPVYYVRDTGLLHALVGIVTHDHLRAHGLVGHSWEGYAIEALIVATDGLADAGFYRNAQGEEIDLVLEFAGAKPAVWAIECKLSPDKDVEPGFFPACIAIEATDRLIVHGGSASAVHGSGVAAVPLLRAIAMVRDACGRVSGHPVGAADLTSRHFASEARIA